MKKLIEFDKALFIKIYNLAERNIFIEKIIILGNKASYYVFLIVFIVGIFLVHNHKPEFLTRFIFIPFFGLIVNTLLRKAMGRRRPINELGISSRIGEKKTNSCPSNHSASAMVITIMFIKAFPFLGTLLIPIALFTGFSRIAIGVHYPLDVILGFFVGIAMVFVGEIIFLAFSL